MSVTAAPRARTAFATILATIAFAACSTSGGASGTVAGTATPPPSAAGGPSSGAASASPPASSSASATAGSSSGGAPIVDLTFSGSLAFHVTEGGTCRNISVSGDVAYDYELTDADQAGIGSVFSLTLAFDRVDLKWLPKGPGAYGRPPTAGTWDISADHHTFTVDSDLDIFNDVASGAGPGPEHLKGTVTCP